MINFRNKKTAMFCMVALAATLAFAGPGLALDVKEIKVGYIPIGDCLQLYVAQDMGFFAEEGVIVDKRPMKGGAVIAPAVEAGEAHIGWSNAISVVVAHSKGFDFAYLTSGALSIEKTNRVHSLLTAKGSAIKQVTDLAGKTVAINTLGNINELSMVALADENGLDIKTVKLVEVPFPNMETALKNGAVDAILAVEPFVTIAAANGSADMLVRSVHKSYGERFMIAGWFAKKSWVARNREQAAAFARAIDKASAYIAENPDKVGNFLVKNTKLTQALIEKITLPAFSPMFDPGDLQPMIELAAKYKFISEPFPATDIIVEISK